MSVQFGPLDHYPGILERKTGLIDLQVQLRDRLNVSGLRLWCSRHPNHLYGPRGGAGAGLDGSVPAATELGRSALLQARPGRFATSSSILTTKKLRFYEEIRGTARFVLDLADFPITNAGPTLVAGTDFTFANANPDTITRNDAGNFINDGFVGGMVITVATAAVGANNGSYTIATGGVAAGVLTLVPTDALTASANDLTAAITSSFRAVPSDDQVVFVAVQQERNTLPVVTVDGFTGRANRVKGAVDTGDAILGPILVIPTVLQMSMNRTTLVISGQAPDASVAMGVAGTIANPELDLQIINPIHFVLPRPTTSFTVRNTDGASALRVSHGLGQQIYEIPNGAERTFFGAVKEVCLQSAAAALCSFSVEANLNLGGSAGGI